MENRGMTVEFLLRPDATKRQRPANQAQPKSPKSEAPSPRTNDRRIPGFGV
jgi:hypothetical protein